MRSPLHFLLAVSTLSGLPSCANREIPDNPGQAGGSFLEPSILDLKVCRMGVSKEFHANLFNYGVKPLEIASFQASCGCTDVRLDKNICEPGGKIEISGTLRPENKAGKFRHRISLFEASPSDRVHLLEVLCETQSEFTLSPEAVTLRPTPFSLEVAQATLTLENRSSERIHLGNPAALPEGFSACLTPHTLKPHEASTILLKADGRFIGDVDYTLKVPTSHPIERLLEIPIHIRPVGGIRIAPTAIRLGVSSKTALLNIHGPLTVHLTGANLNQVSLGKITTPRYLNLSKSEAPASDSLDLCFAFVPDELGGIDLRGELTIELIAKEFKPGSLQKVTYRIPISGILN